MKHSVGPKLLMTALVVLFGLQAPACQQCDTLDEKEILFTEGITNSAGTYYETAPLDGEWLHFPAGRRFDLRHNLRGPALVKSYVSFKPRLVDDEKDSTEDPNNYSEGAGNQVVFEPVDDPQIIRVRNDTCSESYLRIVAITAGDSDLQSLGGAGGSDAVDAGGAGSAAP
jgi:hypothetical protein